MTSGRAARRPADLLNSGFLLFLAGVTIVFYRRIDSPWPLIALYLTLFLLQEILIVVRDRGRVLRFFYDLVFPTISILAVFDSLEYIVHPVNPRDLDPLLIRLDYLISGTYPTVAIEAFSSPLLTDVLQLAYVSYYFLPITLGAVLLKRHDPAFDRALFFIMLCFYLSYVGYILTPALGPRFSMAHLQSRELQGWLLSAPLQELLNRIEGIKRDAFPSGHTAIALTVLYLAHRYDRRLFRIYLPFVSALIVSTVYCRYHYVVDVIAGVLLAVLTVILGERLYGRRPQRDDHSS